MVEVVAVKDSHFWRVMEGDLGLGKKSSAEIGENLWKYISP